MVELDHDDSGTLAFVDEPASYERAVVERMKFVPAVGKPWDGLELVREEVIVDPIDVDLQTLDAKYFVDTQLQCAQIMDADEVYDLHRMASDFARRFMVHQINRAQKAGYNTLYFVTGRGSHDSGHGAPLRRAIERALNALAVGGKIFGYFPIRGVKTGDISAFLVKLYGDDYKPSATIKK